MKLILLGGYTILVAGVWGFFIVARMHAYKFRNFSRYIIPFTNGLMVLLAILTIIGYAIVFNHKDSDYNNYSNNNSSSNSSTNY
ncbi:MAG: hypothetical protein N4A38_02960 [Candidatus Gracilibacteria bacterium]|nr:hypothetical protein [Candidatus Gracilibacteria bacterium]